MNDPIRPANDLATDHQLLAELADGFAQRYRAGERPSVEEYAQKHPELAAEIRDLFPAMLMVEQAGRDPGAMSPPLEQSGAIIGRYQLLERIGEGGFGVVFMAEQHQPVRRKVALKVIKPGLDTKHVIARFEAERQALAMMEHANIAKVLDAGATELGRPYFVMELVHGVPITTYCDDNQLTPRERLELFVKVCHAVQHAHTKGVIHRDIKPTNVLVTLHDGAAEPKVIDFGVAKATGTQPLTEHTLLTQFTQLVGTPLYMSPEQAEMSGMDVDTRSDIYSLGVLLYQILTGTTPFDRDRLRRVGPDEMRRIIREEEPPTPSTRVGTLSGQNLTAVAAHRKTDPKRLGSMLRGDLDWIVMKCLEKDRSRRYETASALTEDIRRHLSNEVISARPPSRVYRTSRFIRRHHVSITAASVVIVALIVGLALAMQGMFAAGRARDQALLAKAAAERADAEAVDANRFIVDLVTSGEPEVQRSKMDAASANLDRGWLKDHPDLQPGVRRHIAHQYRLFARNRVFNDPEQLRQAAERQLRAGIQVAEQVYGPAHEQTLGCVLELGELMADQKNAAAADPLLRRAIDGYGKLSINQPQGLMRALMTLASVRDQQSERGEARALRFQSLQTFVSWKVSLPYDEGDTRQAFGRGVLLSRAGRCQEAVSSLQQGLAHDPTNIDMWLLTATTQLYLADQPAYRETAKQMLARFKDEQSADVAWKLAKAWLLVPCSEPELIGVEALVKRAGSSKSASLVLWYDVTKALLQYRQGSYAQALRTLGPMAATAERIRVPAESGLAIVAFVAAMSHQQLGEIDQGRAALKSARAHLAAAPAPGVDDLDREGAVNVLMAQILSREAESLISAKP